MRREELLALKPENLYEYSVEVRRSLSPTNNDTSLKTIHSRRDVSINKNVYDLVRNIPVKSDGYIFDNGKFHQSEKLSRLLKKVGIKKTTFHGLRDTHASFLFSQEISLEYISQRLGHNSVLTTQNYYLELMHRVEGKVNNFSPLSHHHTYGSVCGGSIVSVYKLIS